MDRVYKLLPPGYELRDELRNYALIAAAASAALLLGFAVIYFGALRDMYYTDDSGARQPLAGVSMAPFGGMLIPGKWAFLAASLVYAALSLRYVGYHYRGGSRAIYTMRRIPSRGEFIRRCFTLPLLGLAAAQTLWRLEALLCGAVYVFVTPDMFLPAEPWLGVLLAAAY